MSQSKLATRPESPGRHNIVQCVCGAYYLRRPSGALTIADGSAHCERCGHLLARWRRGFGAVVFEPAVHITRSTQASTRQLLAKPAT